MTLHPALFFAAGVPTAILALFAWRYPRLRLGVAPFGAAVSGLVAVLAGAAPLTVLAAVAVLAGGTVLGERRRVRDGDEPAPTIAVSLADPVWPWFVLAGSGIVALDPGARLGAGLSVVVVAAAALAILSLGTPAVTSTRTTVVLLGLSTLGLWLAVPDTEAPISLIGGVLPAIVLFGLLPSSEADRSVGRGLAAYAPVFIVAAASGSISGSVPVMVGAIATLGALVWLPLLDLIITRAHVGVGLMIHRRVLIAIQAITAVTASRLAAVRSTTMRSILVSAGVLAAGMLVAVLTTHTRALPVSDPLE